MCYDLDNFGNSTSMASRGESWRSTIKRLEVSPLQTATITQS